MNAPEAPNPISQRLARISRLWQAFRSLPEARVCRWVIQPDERKLVEAFLQTTYRADNPVPDLFLPFHAPCGSAADYGRQLVEELRTRLEADREALAAEGIVVDWQPAPAGDAPGPGYLVRNLDAFSRQAPAAELLVAVLMPPATGKAFARWLPEVLRAGVPAHLRLLVVEAGGAPLPDGLAETFPGRVHTQVLDLDVPGAMRQLAAAGNPADPGVKFRRAFLELAQAASGQPLSTVQRLEALPLSIARAQGWTAMEIAVHSLVASACIGLGRPGDALGRYDLGLGLAKAAQAGGDATAGKLAVQLLSNQGAVYISLKNYREGARAFGEGAGLAEAAGDPFQVMEAKRMQGFCLEKDGDWEQALRVEREGLAAAEKLDETLRHHSTLPYLAESLLALVYRSGDKEDYLRTEAKINALAGPGWQGKLQPAKPVAV